MYCSWINDHRGVRQQLPSTLEFRCDVFRHTASVYFHRCDHDRDSTSRCGPGGLQYLITMTYKLIQLDKRSQGTATMTPLPIGVSVRCISSFTMMSQAFVSITATTTKTPIACFHTCDHDQVSTSDISPSWFWMLSPTYMSMYTHSQNNPWLKQQLGHLELHHSQKPIKKTTIPLQTKVSVDFENTVFSKPSFDVCRSFWE